MKWGLSILDFQHHAINERAYHPIGVYKAECGHLLMMVVELHDVPYGRTCEVHACQQFACAIKG